MFDAQILKQHFSPSAAMILRMDDTSSGLIDQSGNARNGTAVGATASMQPSITVNMSGNTGYSFTGTGRITCGQLVAWRFPYFSYAIWCNYYGPNGANQYPLDNSTGVFMSGMRIDSAGRLLCMVRTGGVARLPAVGTPIVKNNTHLMVTYDGEHCCGYQDGKLMLRSAPAVQGPSEYTTSPIMTIGNQASGASQAFNGLIGGVMVSGTVYTQNQISDYYRDETTPHKKYWLMGTVIEPAPQINTLCKRRAA